MPASADTTPTTAAVSALLGDIAALYRGAARSDGAPFLHAAATLLAPPHRIAHLKAPAPSLSVMAWLDGALAAAREGPLAAIAERFAVLARVLPWSQNPNYVADPPGPDFLARYGYCEIVGPSRPVTSHDVRVGFLLLAPQTLYPTHHHPAEEVYHVVAGAGRWQRGNQSWITRGPGRAIHHAPHTPHATRAGPDPLLALYCWGGMIDTHATLTKNTRDRE